VHHQMCGFGPAERAAELPTKRKLQDNLRHFIDSLERGTLDTGTRNVTPQSKQSLVKIKLTNNHHACKT
jgi:hypothetical protein